MGKESSGAQAWGAYCEICGQHYRYSNLNRRLAINERGEVVDTDQHEAKCRGWKVLSGKAALAYREARRYPFGISGRR